MQVGTFEEFDPKTGALLRQSVWKNGAGTYTIVNSNDSTVTAINSNEKAKAETCLDSWTMAYRKEAGSDVLITSDQISEWEASCKEGKKPN